MKTTTQDSAPQSDNFRPRYSRFRQLCRLYGFSPSTGYILAQAGLLSLMKMGTATMGVTEEFETLPERLAEPANIERIRAVKAASKRRAAR